MRVPGAACFATCNCCALHLSLPPHPLAPPGAGVAVSLLRMATKALLPATPAGLRQSASIYFGLAALLCLTCTLVYTCVLPHLAVVQRRRAAVLQAALLSPEGEEEAGKGALDGTVAQSESPRSPLLPVLAPIPAGSPPGSLGGKQAQAQVQACSPPVSSALKAWQPHSWAAAAAQQEPGSPKWEDLSEAPSAELPGQLPAQLPDEQVPLLTAEQRAAATACTSPTAEPLASGGGLRSPCSDVSGSSGRAGALSSLAVFRRVWQLALTNLLLFT